MFRLKSIRKIAFDWTNVNRAFLHTIIFTSFSFVFFLLFIFVDSIHDNSNEMKIVSLRDLYVTKSVKKMIIIHISFYINVHRRNGTFQSVVQFDFIWWNDIILNYGIITMRRSWTTLFIDDRSFWLAKENSLYQYM